MIKRPFKPAKGVSNIELFYDLIFVYGISVVTAICSNVEAGFLSPSTWIIYLFSLLVILEIWFYTTLLMNRYGDRSLPETAGLFINMFLLYFLANGVHANWHETAVGFDLTWAGILVNLAVQWLIKLHSYNNIDKVDKRIMSLSATTLLIQAGIAAVAAFIPAVSSEVGSWIALLFGMSIWRLSKLYRRKPARFDHVAERCALLTIIAFGEMVVGISTYMTAMSSMLYPVGVFALVVGLFLIYIFEHDHMLDHHARTDGMSFMAISSWLIVVIGNLTIALGYMPRAEIDFLPKNIYLAACLIVYLLTSFLLGRYNKPAYRHTKAYVVGRVAACVFIVAVGVLAGFDSAITLGCHVVAVYAAFLHEWILWYRGTHHDEYGRSLGLDE